MKKRNKRMASLLAEEISHTSLICLTGGTDSGAPLSLYPHDLVTPEHTATLYVPVPPSLTNNP